MQKPHLGELIFFFALFGGIAILAFAIMSPFILPLFLGMVFAVLCQPIYQHLLTMLKGSRSFAALLTVLLVLVLVLIPLMLVCILLFQEVRDLYVQMTQGNGSALLKHFSSGLEVAVKEFVPGFDFHVDLLSYVQGALRWVGQHLSAFFSGILSFLFNVILIVVTMFFLYRDGHRLHAFAIKWSPLADKYDESIIAKLQSAISSVVKGSLTTAAVQGILVGFGLTVFGVPNPILWGVVAMVAALVPVVGTAIVTLPAAFILYLTHHVGSAVGLALYAVFFVGLVDNILHPMFIKRGVDMHPFLILLSIFGGLSYFGPVGFLAGPIILAFFFTLLDMYPTIVKGEPINGSGS